MKTSQDPRHQHRIDLMQKLFANSFQNSPQDADIQSILLHREQIDQQIVEAAPEWPLEKIARIDLAVLRLAIYELIIEVKEPQKVVIDEAVELAKTFGNPNSPAFVNGALGTIIKHSQPIS